MNSARFSMLKKLSLYVIMALLLVALTSADFWCSFDGFFCKRWKCSVRRNVFFTEYNEKSSLRLPRARKVGFILQSPGVMKSGNIARLRGLIDTDRFHSAAGD